MQKKKVAAAFLMTVAFAGGCATADRGVSTNVPDNPMPGGSAFNDESPPSSPRSTETKTASTATDVVHGTVGISISSVVMAHFSHGGPPRTCECGGPYGPAPVTITLRNNTNQTLIDVTPNVQVAGRKSVLTLGVVFDPRTQGIAPPKMPTLSPGQSHSFHLGGNGIGLAPDRRYKAKVTITARTPAGGRHVLFFHAPMAVVLRDSGPIGTP